MNNEDLRAAIHEIVNDAEPGTRAVIEAHYGREWLWDLFSRVALLKGVDEVLYSEVVLEDRNGPTGSIVVFTSRSIVRVAFDNPQRGGGNEWRLDVVAEAVPVSVVERVAVDMVGSSVQQSVEWPLRAQITVHLSREVAGVTTLQIPSAEPAHSDKALRVAGLVRQLTLWGGDTGVSAAQ